MFVSVCAPHWDKYLQILKKITSWFKKTSSKLLSITILARAPYRESDEDFLSHLLVAKAPPTSKNDLKNFREFYPGRHSFDESFLSSTVANIIKLFTAVIHDFS